MKEDLAVLLTGGYSTRDRGEDRAPFVVENARPLEELLSSGALGLALRWKLAEAPDRADPGAGGRPVQQAPRPGAALY